MTPAQQGWDSQEAPGPRVNQASLGSQELQDRKEHPEVPAFQGCRATLVPKAKRASQDSKVLPVSRVQRVWTVPPVTPVSVDHRADQENRAVPVYPVSPVTRVRQGAMASPDQLGSKETQDCQALVDQGPPVLQVSLVQRETLVSQVSQEAQASLVPRERQASPAFQDPQAAPGPRAQPGWPTRGPKAAPAPPAHLVVEVPLVQRVLAGQPVAVGSRVRRESLVPPVSPGSPV